MAIPLEYIRTDRNGTEIYHDWNCPRCGGAGQSDNWWRTGKTCYECGGTGRRIKPAIVKKYTPEHEAVLAEKAHKRFLKRQAEENAAFFRKNGFAEDGTGYGVYGRHLRYKGRIESRGRTLEQFSSLDRAATDRKLPLFESGRTGGFRIRGGLPPCL